MLRSRRFGSTFCRFGGLTLALLLGACAAPTESADTQAEHTEATSSALTVFSVNAYENGLVNALQNANGMGGYSYAIYQNGALVRSGAAGWARTSPPIPWTADIPFSMMSMGKTITGAATVKLLAERDDISLGSSIKPYLPSGWNPDGDLNGVTFRHILSHTGGFTAGADPWAGIKTQVESGVLPPGSSYNLNGNVVPAGVGTYLYSNTDFTLQRVMMAYMLDKQTATVMEALGQGPSYTAMTYRSRVLTSIFQPIGLGTSQVDAQPIGSYPAGFYNANGSAWYFEDQDGSTILKSGAGFWNLSVKSYAKFIDALSHGKYAVAKNGTTIDPWQYMTTMVSATNSPNVGLGLFRKQGTHGDYFTHNGGYGRSSGAGACAEWMTYPNGVTAVWVMNSLVSDGNGGTMCPVDSSGQMMADAYDNAWMSINYPLF